jgi:GMP synthase PP-ATPase subunit
VRPVSFHFSAGLLEHVLGNNPVLSVGQGIRILNKVLSNHFTVRRASTLLRTKLQFFQCEKKPLQNRKSTFIPARALGIKKKKECAKKSSRGDS